MKQFHMNTGKSILLFAHRKRRGVTLMEVLMSVMIMSIGVVSLASLFPISILRGVQATKLTNATVLRYNAEALIDAFPLPLVFDPDNDSATDSIDYQRRNRKYIVDPLGSFYASEDGTGIESVFGHDGSFGSTTSIPRYNARMTTLLSASNFFSQQDSWTLLYEGIPSGVSTDRKMISIDIADISSGTNPAGIVSLSELQSILNGSVAGGRVLIFDSTGKQAIERRVVGSGINVGPGIGMGDISFYDPPTTTEPTPDDDPLPNNGLYGAPSKIRIEIFDQRYSYLLTVRRQIATNVASVDVVVFFRRNFNPEFETVHSVTDFISEWDPGPDGDWGVTMVDDDNDGTTDERAGEQGWPGSDDFQRRTFRLHFNTSVDRPKLTRGGYVFDTKNARWYQIQKIEDEMSATPLITLDQPIVESINTTADRSVPTPGLILMPNVVQVYPLGNKTL